MDAIQRRMLIFQQKLCRADIRREHAFLDQTMRIVAQRRDDLLDLADVIEHHHCFCGVKIDRTTLVTRGQQNLEYRIQLAQVRQQIFFDAVIGLQGIDCLGHVRISEACGGMKHRLHELVALDLAGCGN